MTLVLLDLVAAFDAIEHHTLPGYLKFWISVTGTVLMWCASYLSDHFRPLQKVQHDLTYLNTSVESAKHQWWVGYCSQFMQLCYARASVLIMSLT